MAKKILYVYAPAGPPLDYCFPKIARRADIHTCVVSPPSESNYRILRRYSASITDFSHLMPIDAVAKIADVAREVKPDAIFTFSEFLLKSVSELALAVGLRGVGPNIGLGRDKVAMRERWASAGIPQPAFRAIRSLEQTARIAELQFPVLIKLAYGAGSIGQQIVHGMNEIDDAIERLIVATDAARQVGKHEFSEQGFPLLIAEEIIRSTTDSWYDVDGYGDYLSVEGLVRDGVYYPLAMTGRLRTIPPFTELGNVAPCVIAQDKKRELVELIRRAVDALQFDNCATHTEVKLMANGQVSFLETAARMGGVAIAKEIDEVFGVDYVDLFISVMLDEETRIPAFEEQLPRCAAASVALMGCDSNGNPWPASRIFAPASVPWSELVGGLAQVDVQMAQSVPVGTEVHPYDDSGGLLNYAGQAFLTSPRPTDLKAAAYRLLDGLEAKLPPAV